MGIQRPGGERRLWASVHTDRANQRRASIRTYRTANAKATTKTLPVAQRAACQGPSRDRTLRSCKEAKVSAILLKLCIKTTLRRSSKLALRAKRLKQSYARPHAIHSRQFGHKQFQKSAPPRTSASPYWNG